MVEFWSIIYRYLPQTLGQWGLLSMTVVLYILGRYCYLRSALNPLLIPVLTVVVVIVGVLLWWGVPYELYAQSTRGLQLLIGPATVAMAIPLYMHLPVIKRLWKPLLAALVVGSVVAILSTVLIAWSFGASHTTIASIVAKSATMPVSIPASEAIGGIGSLAAISAALTGISGVLMAGPLFALLRIKDKHVQSFTLGLAAHAIGTARAVQDGNEAAAMAAIAMGLTALLTGALVPFVPWLLVLLG